MEIQNLLQQILNENILNNEYNEIKQYIIDFYSTLHQSKENQLQQIITIPIKDLLNQINLNESNQIIQLLLTPIYHIITSHLSNNKQDEIIQNIINDSIDENEEIISYFNRFDLSKKTIPSPTKQTDETLKSIIKTLDNTIPIELDYETFEERQYYYGIKQKKHIAMIFGRNYLFYNQNEENALKEINLDSTKDGAPLLEENDYSTDFSESIIFYHGVTCGLTSENKFSFEGKIDLDEGTIGLFLGNCIKGYCSEMKLDEIYQLMSIPNERLQASVLLGLMISYKNTNNSSIIEILKVIADPSLHGCPSLVIQSMALIAMGLISSSKTTSSLSLQHLENIMMSHICSPLNNSCLGFHHIW